MMQTVTELAEQVETLKRLVGMLTWELMETKRQMVEMEREAVCESQALLDHIRMLDAQAVEPVWE
jgi:tRNA A58 N-methylase Trm61